VICASSGPYSIEVTDTGDEASIRFRSAISGRPFGSCSISSDGLAMHFCGPQAGEFAALLASVAWQMVGETT
jgi:hypothetical protein